MSQKNTCRLFSETSQFNEDFIKRYNEDSDEGCFLKVNVHYPEKLHARHNDLPFILKE